jgi:hypothetical protein
MLPRSAGIRNVDHLPLSRVNPGREREPVYAVDDIAGMLFLRTAPNLYATCSPWGFPQFPRGTSPT